MPSRNYFVLGLTGSIGSGKSAAAQAFEKLGAAIVDADLLAREVVEPGSPGLNAISAQFGANFLTSAGTLDRKKLGQVVFSDQAQRKKLEAILHPLIRAAAQAKIQQLTAQARSSSAVNNRARSVIIYVIPLLFEVPYQYPELDAVAVVSCVAEVAIKRIMARDSCSEELAMQKLATQLPIEEKVRMADFVITNDGTLQELEDQVTKLYQFFIDQD